MTRFGVLLGDETDKGSCELAQAVGGEKSGRGGSQVAADEASEDWRDEVCNVRVKIEALVVKHGEGELHHFSEDK